MRFRHTFFVLFLACAAANAEDEAARRERLENLSVTEQEELRQQRDKFARLEATEQQRMRELHAQISSSPDSDRLHSVMVQYHAWLKTLTGQERADLFKLPPNERVAAIKRMMEQQRQQRFRDIVRTLAPEDGPVIFEWLDHYAANHQDELIALLPEKIREPMEKHLHQDKGLERMARMRLMMALGTQQLDVSWPAPTDEEIQELNTRLSGKAKLVLAEVPSREQKLQLVREWVRAAVASRMTPQISRDRLMAFYRDYREQSTDTKRIEELDSLAPDEFYEQVSKLYLRTRGHWRGRPDGDRGGDHRGDRDRHRDDDHRRGPGPPRGLNSDRPDSERPGPQGRD